MRGPLGGHCLLTHRVCTSHDTIAAHRHGRRRGGARYKQEVIIIVHEVQFIASLRAYTFHSQLSERCAVMRKKSNENDDLLLR